MPVSLNIESSNIASAWEESIVFLIHNSNDLVRTERFVRAKETIGARIQVSNPMYEPAVSPKYIFGDLFIQEYRQNILAASQREPSSGKRIKKENGLASKDNNQIDKVVELLKKEKSSRKAIISLWDYKQDILSQHPPCALSIQFLCRNHRLNTVAYFRSNDAWMSLLPDMIVMRDLTKIISDRLGIQPGVYIHYAASLHLYEPDIIPAMKYFNIGI
jgi:thymidylate synthase